MLHRLPPNDRNSLERLVIRLWPLGPRVITEAMAEVAITGDLAALERYERLTPEMLSAAGGTGFAPRPTLRVVPK